MHLMFGVMAAVIVKLHLSPAIISLAGARPGTRCGNDLFAAYLLLAMTAFGYYLLLKTMSNLSAKWPN